MSQDGFFASLKGFFGNKQIEPLPTTKAEDLYYQILQASRAVPLYRDYGVEDTIDGRFDALCLLQSLVMRRLAGKSEALGLFSQELFDAMFADMDSTLREMGVGDMGVGKRVKFMSEAYMGRLTAYDNALKAYEQGEGADKLQEALYRNLFSESGDEAAAKALVAPVAAMADKLASCADSDFTEAALADDILAIVPRA